MRARVFLVACALAAALTGCGGVSPASTPVPVTWSGGILAHPLAKPEFVLTDTSGSRFDFQKQTRGRVTLLYFGYTHCPDACPTTMATVANAYRSLTAEQRSKVTVVFVTTDPARDTPPVLRAWLDQYSKDFVGLTGAPADLINAQVALALPVASEEPVPGGGYAVSHATFMPVFSQDDQAHMTYVAGTGLTRDGLARDLTQLLAGEVPS